MTHPVRFSVQARTSMQPSEIIEAFFNVDSWSDFAGWGPIPGIREASIVEQTEARVGTTFAVTNSDGSTHRERVIEFVPNRRLVMRIDGFSAPLHRLAGYFVETWQFERRDGVTDLQRSFELHAKGPITKIFLKLIGFGLKRAVRAHTLDIVISHS